jgi:hypothetical protein
MLTSILETQVDETDRYVDNHSRQQAKRQSTAAVMRTCRCASFRMLVRLIHPDNKTGGIIERHRRNTHVRAQHFASVDAFDHNSHVFLRAGRL